MHTLQLPIFHIPHQQHMHTRVIYFMRVRIRTELIPMPQPVQLTSICLINDIIINKKCQPNTMPAEIMDRKLNDRADLFSRIVLWQVSG